MGWSRRRGQSRAGRIDSRSVSARRVVDTTLAERATLHLAKPHPLERQHQRHLVEHPLVEMPEEAEAGLHADVVEEHARPARVVVRPFGAGPRAHRLVFAQVVAPEGGVVGHAHAQHPAGAPQPETLAQQRHRLPLRGVFQHFAPVDRVHGARGPRQRLLEIDGDEPRPELRLGNEPRPHQRPVGPGRPRGETCPVRAVQVDPDSRLDGSAPEVELPFVPSRGAFRVMPAGVAMGVGRRFRGGRGAEGGGTRGRPDSVRSPGSPRAGRGPRSSAGH